MLNPASNSCIYIFCALHPSRQTDFIAAGLLHQNKGDLFWEKRNTKWNELVHYLNDKLELICASTYCGLMLVQCDMVQ